MMKKMKHIQMAHIMLHAIPGQSIGHCLQEAIEVASREWENVVLIHDDKRYPIYVNDLLTIVLEAAENRKLHPTLESFYTKQKETPS